MNNNKEVLIENIYLKKRINRWRVIVFLLAVIGILMLPSKKGGLKNVSGLRNMQDYVARITIEGHVTENNKRLKNLERLALNPNVKAVILHIDTPGGTFVGGEALYHSLNYLASKKPLVATMGTMATSVGYMISLPAERVFAYRGTITGSIGVFVQAPDFSELTKKLGVNFITVKSGKFKTTLSPFEPTTDEGKRTIEAAINDSYITFIDFIVKQRKLEKDKLLEIADGRIYTGNQAVDLNLIDEIGDQKTALNWLQKNKKIGENLAIKDVDLVKDKIFLEKYKLNSLINEFFLGKMQMSLAGLISIWQN
jgi:protease-4